jgi:hypothetical protein
MTARDIALTLGGQRAQRLSDGSFLVSCPVPSHGKGRGDRSPSLQISDGDSRLLVHCHAGCDPLGVVDELRRRGLLDDRHPVHGDDHRRRHHHHVDDRGAACGDDVRRHRDRQHEKAAWLWSQRKPITGTAAERYLRSRGITCVLPKTLAFLPPTKPEHHPVMIGAFGIPDEPEPGALGVPRNIMSVHITLLKPDGSGKADVEKPKLIVGSPGVLPIVLAPPNDLLGLAVTEGIEDGLSAHQVTGLGAWAAGSSGRVPKIAESIASYVECVTIYQDDDYAGEKGARGLATALSRRGIEVRIEGMI